MFSCREIRLASGERMVLLVDRHTNFPHPDATRYILSTMRPRGLSVNSMRARLQAIAVGLEFLKERCANWPDRVLSGQFLDYSEALTLLERCRVDRHTGTRLLNPISARSSYSAIIEYLTWLARPLISGVVTADRQIYVSSALVDFRSMALGLAMYRSNNSVKDAVGLGLTNEQRKLFMSAITPGSAENPFAQAHQYRNYVLLMLHYHLGCREGEMLSLKIKDIDFSSTPATITIHRRHNDPEDPRRRQPVAKTRARLLEVSDDLAALLRCWILLHRSDRRRYPQARKHPFLAVNRFGAPLSLRGYERIFAALRKRHSALHALASHLLRHDWNDRFLAQAQAANTDPIEVEKDQIYAMGWSDHSKMPQRYGRRAIRRSTGTKMLQMQQKAFENEST